MLHRALMTKERSPFCRRLVAARDALNLTQKEAAELLGISPTMLSQYERGARTPKAERIAKMASAYRVAPLWLTHGDRAEKLASVPVLGHVTADSVVRLSAVPPAMHAAGVHADGGADVAHIEVEGAQMGWWSVRIDYQPHGYWLSWPATLVIAPSNERSRPRVPVIAQGPGGTLWLCSSLEAGTETILLPLAKEPVQPLRADADWRIVGVVREFRIRPTDKNDN